MSITFSILCVIFLYIQIQLGGLFKILFKSPIKLETIEQAKNLKAGDTVNLDITKIDGHLASYYYSSSKSGLYDSYNEKSRYYTVPFDNSNLFNYEEWHVAVKLDRSDFDKAEKAKHASSFSTKVLLSVYGVVKDMSDEEKKYATSNMDMIYIQVLDKKRTLIVSSILLLILVLSIAFIVFYIKDKKKEKAISEDKMKINNPNNYQVPQNIYVQ